MAIVTAQEFAAPDLDEGSYDARIIEAGEVDGIYGHQLRVDVAILDEDGEPLLGETGEAITLPYWVNLKTARVGKKSNLYQLLDAVLYSGRGIPEGETINTADVKGRRCRVLVRLHRKDDGTELLKVESVSPFERRARRQPQATGQAPVAAPTAAEARSVEAELESARSEGSAKRRDLEERIAAAGRD